MSGVLYLHSNFKNMKQFPTKEEIFNASVEADLGWGYSKEDAKIRATEWVKNIDKHGIKEVWVCVMYSAKDYSGYIPHADLSYRVCSSKITDVFDTFEECDSFCFKRNESLGWKQRPANFKIAKPNSWKLN